MIDPTGDEAIGSSVPLIVAQLTAGKGPGEIEARLVEQGQAPRAARSAVKNALSDHTEALQKSANQDQLVGILSLPFCTLIFLVCAGRCFFEDGITIPGRVKLFIGIIFGGLGAIDAIYRLLRSRTTKQELRQLDHVWDRWKEERPRHLAAPPDDGVPLAAFAKALPPQVSPPLRSVRTIPDRLHPSASRDIRSAKPAKIPEDQSLRPWVIGSVVGAVGVVGAFLLVLGLILSVSLGKSRTARAEAPSTGSAPPPAAIDPNAPLDDEGPPPEGWTVLFRADDPAIWNTPSPGEKFAIPMKQAHSTIRFLRLKRMDTRAVLIVPITHKQLASQPNLPILEGVEWNGTNRLEYGGYHLGILRGPRLNWPGFEHGTISILNDGWNGFAGSGFGHKIGGPEKQCYCWQGKEIPRTPFEIAFTVGPLTPEEEKHVVK